MLPELNGKLDGFAVRVPTINVSFVDLTFIAKRDTSVEEINALMKEASQSEDLAGIFGYNGEDSPSPPTLTMTTTARSSTPR